MSRSMSPGPSPRRQAIENDSLSGATPPPALARLCLRLANRGGHGGAVLIVTASRARDALTVEPGTRQAAEGARWLFHPLRTENGGARWDSAAGVFEMLGRRRLRARIP